jgi:hypothetical protein
MCTLLLQRSFLVLRDLISLILLGYFYCVFSITNTADLVVMLNFHCNLATAFLLYTVV